MRDQPAPAGVPRMPSIVTALAAALTLVWHLFVWVAPVVADEELATRIEAARSRYGVPGLAVAAVADDRIVFARGFGVTTVAGGHPVDEHTLFSIASVTKSFTASAVAVLEAKGELDWNDRVVDHLPWFELSDPYASRQATLIDLASHRTGLARGDRIAMGGFDRLEIVRRLRDEPFSRSFREGYSYSNVLYTALGLVIEARSGSTFEEFVRRELFAPAGMTDSRFYGPELLRSNRRARPQTVLDYLGPEVHEVSDPERLEDGPQNYAPAGGIYSTAHDLALWVREQLRLEQGRSVLAFDAEAARRMREIRTPIPSGGYRAAVYPDAEYLAYGLGWFVTQYRGEKLVFHPGGGTGAAATVAFLPGRGVGVAVLANHGWVLKDVVANTVLDALIGVDGSDWAARLDSHRESPEDRVGYYRELANQRVADTAPSLPLAAYEGVYEHPVYGSARVSLADGRLELRWGKVVADLEHWHFDTFAAYHRLGDIGFDTVTFRLDAAGRAREITILDVDGYVRQGGGHHP